MTDLEEIRIINQSMSINLSSTAKKLVGIRAALKALAVRWDEMAQRPNCTDRMKKRTLRECRDELLAVLKEHPWDWSNYRGE